LHSAISNARIYDEHLINIESIIADSNFTAAVNKYLDLESFYNTNFKKNDSITIDHQPILDYAEAIRSYGFAAALIEVYLSDKNIDRSLHLLNIINDWYDYPKNFILLQKEAGSAIATLDHAEDPDQLPELKVIEYTNQQPGLNAFQKAYLKTWKSLSK